MNVYQLLQICKETKMMIIESLLKHTIITATDSLPYIK